MSSFELNLFRKFKRFNIINAKSNSVTLVHLQEGKTKRKNISRDTLYYTEYSTQVLNIFK